MPEFHIPNSSGPKKCPRCGRPYYNICECGYSPYPRFTNVSGAVIDSTIAATDTLDIASHAMPRVEQEYETVTIIWRPSIDRILEEYIIPIWNSRKRIDLLFRSKMKRDRLFNLSPDDPLASIAFSKNCTSEKDFIDKVQNLAVIITNLNVKVLRDLITSSDSDKIEGRLNLLEAVLQEIYPHRDLSAIQTLRDIQGLRSKSFPVHSTGTNYLKAIKKLGIEYSTNDWQTAWETILRKCRDALREIENILK